MEKMMFGGILEAVREFHHNKWGRLLNKVHMMMDGENSLLIFSHNKNYKNLLQKISIIKKVNGMSAETLQPQSLQLNFNRFQPNHTNQR